MILSIYSVYDIKAEAYDRPFFLHNDKVAIRALADVFRDKDHQYAAHSEDYRLVCLGEFRDDIGAIDAHSPRLVIELAALAATVKQEA